MNSAILAAPPIFLRTPLAIFAFTLGFFFSSRRRHTRYIGDWSSDVCSSDLLQRGDPRVSLLLQCGGRPGRRGLLGSGSIEDRSEERRVGKECRSRWWRYH